MNLPILGKLKDGVKFDFATLADNSDQTEQFWEWWWAEKAKFDQISRPEVISDEDPILCETVYKTTADLYSYREFFDRILFRTTEAGILPAKPGLTRESFRNALLRIVSASAVKLAGRPQLIFAGGGYGSGKTTTLNWLAERRQLPVGMSHLVGADVFKSLLPEYNLIKAVADGRASLTAQKECVMLSTALFQDLVDSERSFIWDSSMSNKDETMDRIQAAKEKNYELSMVAVLTPLQIAITQAMHRARISRRFPNPDALPKSHVAFRQLFTNYIPLFDHVKVFANQGEKGDILLVAEKLNGGKELEIFDTELFNSFLAV